MTAKKQTQAAAVTSVQMFIPDHQLKELALEGVKAHVATLLTDQLDNIIAGEIAKMRLFKPGTSALTDRIEKKMEDVLSAAMSKSDMREKVEERINRRVREAIDGTIKPQVRDIAKRVVARMHQQVRNEVDGILMEEGVL